MFGKIVKVTVFFVDLFFGLSSNNKMCAEGSSVHAFSILKSNPMRKSTLLKTLVLWGVLQVVRTWCRARRDHSFFF